MAIGIEAAVSGIQATEVQAQSRANNIANLNTDGYNKERVLLTEESPSGVSASVEPTPSEGSYVTDISAEGYEFAEGSNVELSEEMAGMVNTKTTYSANLKTVQTADEMASTLLDIKA